MLFRSSRLRDGKEIEVPGPALVRDQLMKRIKDSEISELLKEYGLMP